MEAIQAAVGSTDTPVVAGIVAASVVGVVENSAVGLVVEVDSDFAEKKAGWDWG